MQLKLINQIHRKELILFFASPVGYLFLGAFLAATLFVFFWGEAFFARNIADVRPMFEWLPILLIFLSAALTMRMWSEERRSGTLEFVATVPVRTWEFVLGKFLACWVLLLIALVLTLPLPISVAMVASLDWGPVLAGYLAAMLLGGAYLSVGLFISARTDSQIVALLLTSLICGCFYLLGSPLLTNLFSSDVQSLLLGLGSGSRFEAITRGVVDLRDLYFYLSVAVAFLALNVYALERERWAADGDPRRHQAWTAGTALLVTNLLLANVWLSNITALRLDATQGKIYSISDATRGYLSQLREPLLIRGYFSDKTHPLLAPLVPRMKDLLREYEVAGAGKVRVEIIDPAKHPELEHDANSRYGIQAVPFQIPDRHQTALVNAYFDVLVSYGDEYEVLGFRDLIEVKAEGESSLDVQLMNPEFDLTRSIKKVLYGFSGGASVFDAIPGEVTFTGYVSAQDKLPDTLIELQNVLQSVLTQVAGDSGGRFSYELLDPEAGDGSVAREIAEQYGFQPMAASLFDDTRFYFHLTLNDAQSIVQLPLPEAVSEESVRRMLNEGLKRFAKGLLKNVVLSAPQPPSPYMQPQGPMGNQFTQLQGFLSNDFEVAADDLNSGVVPAEADLLMVVDPQNFTDKQVFAMDQFLMRGGTVVVASGAFASQATSTSLSAVPRDSGIDDWLRHHGVEVGQSMVMDPRNAAFPVPVMRDAGGFTFQDLVMLDYPYFIDVRDEGLNQDSPVVAGLPDITVSWASPLTVAQDAAIDTTVLLRSSAGSWLSEDTNVMPRFDELGGSAFVAEGEQRAHVLGVALQGRFDSYFAGQDSPLITQAAATQDSGDAADEHTHAGHEDEEGMPADLPAFGGVIGRSSESARLVVFGSNDFLADQTLRMVGSVDGVLYANSIQMMANLVDWSLEDSALIGIRARSNFNRTLPNLSDATRNLLEYGNYGLALLGIGVVMFIFRRRGRKQAAVYRSWLRAQAGGEA